MAKQGPGTDVKPAYTAAAGAEGGASTRNFSKSPSRKNSSKSPGRAKSPGGGGGKKKKGSSDEDDDISEVSLDLISIYFPPKLLILFFTFF